MQRTRHRLAKLTTLFTCNITTLRLSLVLLVLLAKCNLQVESNYIESSIRKPSILLILPQSFKVSVSSIDQVEDGELNSEPKLQQYVAIVNNIKDERENDQLRGEYRKLSLQIRDADSPKSGQLFYEHIFDYFDSSLKHLLVPINLDQVSPSQQRLQSKLKTRDRLTSIRNENNEPIVVIKPKKLIVSVRPLNLDAGFGSDSIEFVSSAPVPVESLPSSDGGHSFAVIQTDKSVYKPEDKVRIRALVVNENLRPLTKEELKIQIRNPQQIVVEEIKFPRYNESSSTSITDNSNGANNNLFLDYLFEFPPEPMQGTWTAHLLHSDPIANDSISFVVREYVLPRFEINLEVPKYITPSTQNLSVTVYARYQFAKAVQGKVSLRFAQQFGSSHAPIFRARSQVKEIDPDSGKAEFKINSNEFTEKFKTFDWFPGISGSKLYVEATVIESATGHKEIQSDGSCVFVQNPYIISFDDSIGDFKPGFNQQLSVRVLDIMTRTPIDAGHKVVAQYTTKTKVVLSSSPLYDPEQPVVSNSGLQVEAITDDNGQATFNIIPIKSEESSIIVNMRVLNSTLLAKNQEAELKAAEIGRGTHELFRHQSSSGYISLMNKTMTQLEVGDMFISDIIIQEPRVNHQKIYYIIMARGRIFTMDRVNSEGLVSFRVTEPMMPSIRVVLFAPIYEPSEVLSDSMKVNVHQDMDCGLKLRYKSSSSPADSKTVKPNDKGKLAIQARQGDLVSIIGVDSATYSLYNRTRLESSKIVERIKRLDPGCGAGGGKSDLDVFHNSGLMLFSEAEFLEGPQALALGSFCQTMLGQLKIGTDVQDGYSRPQYEAWAQLHRSRTQPKASTAENRSLAKVRNKRAYDVEALIDRYKDTWHRNCCKLGSLEDRPHSRSCDDRAEIVNLYEGKPCADVYRYCCIRTFEREIALGNLGNGLARDNEPRIYHLLQSPQNSEPAPNIEVLSKFESETLVRKYFRETWLFDMVDIISADGSGTMDVQLPHSITSWQVSAMALNRHQPMCLMSQPIKLTTFQDIFLHVSMPYKLIQGEQLDLVATVFNYSPQAQEVFVYTYGIDNVCSEAEPGERSARKRIRIDKHSSQSVLFPMIPLKTGKYPIKILALAVNSNTSDIVEQELRVVPRGKPVVDETTFSLDPMNHQRRSKRAIQTRNLVDEIDSSKGLQRSQVRLTPTRGSDFIVPETKECIVSAIGDRMGHSVQTALHDVENLIRLPHGCGEQVMIYLGPTLYTARYLSTINKLSGELRWRAIKYIKSGYKRILNYRTPDGAFSAFAGRDPSIWLTAFIAKMLCQTERTKFIAEEIHVDKRVVNAALEWLIARQNKNTGMWIEVNPVYHSEMLGGVLRENALTSFVIVTLNECAHHSVDLIEEVELKDPDNINRHSVADNAESSYQHGNAATNGVDKLKLATQKAEQALMLARWRATKENNPYVMALTAYALSFSRPHDAVETLNDLRLKADSVQSKNWLSWRGDYPIETAAYTLQALVELAPTIDPTGQSAGGTNLNTVQGERSAWSPGSDAISIANWLSSKRSTSGAFESTQDTVVALEALSKLAQAQSVPGGNVWFPTNQTVAPNLMCNVTINNRTRRSIEFGKDNAQVLQSFKLEASDVDPVSGDTLEIFTSGNGLGTMSVKVKYNVFHEEDSLCRINIGSTIEEWRPPKVNLPTPQRKNMDNIRDGLPTDVDSQRRPNYQDTATNQHPDLPETKTESEIGDNYFQRVFKKSTLAELNLLNGTQLAEPEVSRSTRESPMSSRKRQQPTKRPTLRLRRQVAEQQVAPAQSSSSSSWSSRFMVRLSSFFISTSPKPFTNSRHDQMQNDAPARRMNTTRRSTGSQAAGMVPQIARPTGIPANAKFNNLSSALELSSNGTPSGDNYTSSVLSNPSSKLILLLKVCVYHVAYRNSEMAVVEIGILSGFRPNEMDLNLMVKDPETTVMKYEILADKSLVLIYMHYIPSGTAQCINFRLHRETLVNNLQSGYIRAYEYYSPLNACSSFYTPKRQLDLLETKCDQTRQVCKCASKSLCPATDKLIDVSELYLTNSTSAESHFTDLICSERYDFVAVVKLDELRHFEMNKMSILHVKVTQDLRGNLTKIMDLQRRQIFNPANYIEKPKPLYPTNTETTLDPVAESGTSLDHLSLSLDFNCIKNYPLLHPARANQTRQRGDLMLLFGKLNKLEKRHLNLTPKSAQLTTTAPAAYSAPYPRASPSIMNGLNSEQSSATNTNQAPTNRLNDAQQTQYSTTMQLDRDSILHNLEYHGTHHPLWKLFQIVNRRSKREGWTCPT